MSIINFLKLKEKFEIQSYRRPRDIDKNNFVPFTGSPRKHPRSTNKIFLIVDPFSPNTLYYEFRIKDIGFAEEQPKITTIDGDSVPMARIWVKKHSVGVQCTPFIVDDILRPEIE